jgi:hypothetical protein
MRKIVITPEDREDGGLHVCSRDVRALHLSGAEPRRVWANIGPAVAHLLRVNEGCRVRKVYYPRASRNGDSPRDVDYTYQFVRNFMPMFRGN